MNNEIVLDIQTNDELALEINTPSEIPVNLDSQSGGISNYNALSNKPKINGVVLQGDKSSSDIKVQDQMDVITNQDIDNLIYGGL